MARAKTQPKGQAIQKVTGPGRSQRGAKLRAIGALIKKGDREIAEQDVFAFWSAHTLRVPPPLRTSFGNFTTVNSVERYSIDSYTAYNNYVWIPWTPSPIAALFMTGNTSAAPQQLVYNTLATASPQSIRPLRMSWSCQNITQAVNVAGSIRVYSYDNSLAVGITLPTTSTSGVSFPSGVDTQLGDLINGNPDTEEFSAVSLENEHLWVSVPASYPNYNSYFDFLALQDKTDAAVLSGRDAAMLILGTENVTNYAAGTVTTGNYPNPAALGGLPPMRGFLVEIPKTPTVQTYRFEFHRQDGARYPVNSLGHSFSNVPSKMPAHGEDVLLQLAKRVSESPARAVADTLVAASAGAGHHINNMLADAVSSNSTQLLQAIISSLPTVLGAVQTAAPVIASGMRAMAR